MGQQHLADADRVGSRRAHYLSGEAVPHHSDLRGLLRCAFVCSYVVHGHHSFLAEVAPITGPMYQLFIFFMITDPKTTVKPRWAQCLVAALVAVAEMIFRLAENVHAPYYALAVVGPAANAFEIYWKGRRPRLANPRGSQ